MAYYMTPLGEVILYPEIADGELTHISPRDFVEKLLAANMDMPVKLLTRENITYTYMGMVTLEHLKLSPLLHDLPAQRVLLLQLVSGVLQSQLVHLLTFLRWEQSADWYDLSFLLNGDAHKSVVQRPPTGPASFVCGDVEFSFPLGYEHLFTSFGLNVKGYIDCLKSHNTIYHELLHGEVLREGVRQFALKGIPGGDRELAERFLSDLEDHLAPPLRSEPTQVVKREREKPKSNEPSKKKHPRFDDMTYAMNNVPHIQFIDENRRSRLLSRGCSIHVALPPDNPGPRGLRPERTHLHALPDLKELKKIEIVASYNRAIVVEFESAKLRDLGMQQIARTKFSYGPTIFNPIISLFAESKRTRDTVWSLSRSRSDHPHSVHEALRRFFCLQGQVPFKDLIEDQSNSMIKKKFKVHHRDSPCWLHKLTAQSRQDTVYEMRDAQSCEICGSMPSAPPSQSATVVTQERHEVSRISQPRTSQTCFDFGATVQLTLNKLEIERPDQPPLRKRKVVEIGSPKQLERLAPPRKQRINEHDVVGGWPSEIRGGGSERVGEDASQKKQHIIVNDVNRPSAPGRVASGNEHIRNPTSRRKLHFNDSELLTLLQSFSPPSGRS